MVNCVTGGRLAAYEARIAIAAPSGPMTVDTASMSATVVISNYNYGRYLRQCIDSALAQTVPAEVIVVDDASTDDSAEVIQSYGDEVVFVSFPENRGQAAALNAGIEIATGDVVLLLDSDDWVVSNRVERVVHEFSADDAIQAVRHDVSAVDVNGRLLSDQHYGFVITSNPGNEVLFFGRTPGSTGCMGFRSSFLRDLGPIPEHRFRRAPDYYLIVAAAMSGQLGTITESLTVRRFHDSQMTSRLRTDWSLVPSALASLHFEAQSAAQLAERVGGPQAIASRSTWWQLKIAYEQSKVDGAGGRWVSVWLRHLAATVRAQVPARRKIGELGRSAVLGLLPRRVFLYAWWRTHIGRPRLRAIDSLRTGRLLTAKTDSATRT